VGAAAAVVPAAGAAPTPVGGCPASYEQTSSGGFTGGLWTVKEANKKIAAPGVDLSSDDRNGDGYICIKFVPNFPPDRFFPAFVFHDNNV
jgi:hypothetical protein